VLEGVQRRRVPGSAPGLEIALLDWGGGGPVALAHHANGFCAALWEPLARALRGRLRIVAMDARGHGASSKPGDPAAYTWTHFAADVIAVADALAALHGRPLALGLGHSFGGTSLLLAAARRPDLFADLVLVDPVVYAESWRRQLAAAGAGASSGLADRARKRRRHWPSRAEALRHLEGRALFASWTPRARELYVEHALRAAPDGGVELACAPETEAEIFERGAQLDLDTEVVRLAAPVLFLHAARGNFPRGVYESLAARSPHGEVQELAAGHLVLMEQPELVLAALEAWRQRSTG
jgi:pimeloyl-ACP methyl ester carboxylesterase